MMSYSWLGVGCNKQLARAMNPVPTSNLWHSWGASIILPQLKDVAILVLGVPKQPGAVGTDKFLLGQFKVRHFKSWHW